MVSEFQNKRGIIQTTMEGNLKLKLEGNETEEGVNAVAISLQLKNVDLPEAYYTAVAEKQVSSESMSLSSPTSWISHVQRKRLDVTCFFL